MATKTLCTGGGAAADYTLFSTYETYQVGLGTWSANETLQIKWVSSADEVNWTHTPTAARGGFTYKIMAFPTHGIADHANKATNPLFYDNTKGACWKYNGYLGAANQIDLGFSTNGPFILEGLQLDHAIASAQVQLYMRNISDITIQNCILRTDSTTGNIFVTGSVTRTTTIDDNLMIITGGGNAIGFESGGGTHTVNIRRNTLINTGSAGSSFGIKDAFGTNGGVLYNTAVAGFNTDCSWTPTSGSHNASDKASGGLPATNRKDSLVLATEFVSATADFRVKGSTSVKLLDFGTAQGPSTDIIGQADNGTRDIGAWEYHAAATIAGNPLFGGATAHPIRGYVS